MMHDKRNFHPGGGRAVNPGQPAGRHNVGEEGFIGEAREREGQVTQVVPNGGEGRGAGRDGDRNETAVGEAARDTAPDASPGLPLHVASLAHTDLSVGAPAAAAGGGVVGGTQEGDEGTGVNAADQETLTRGRQTIAGVNGNSAPVVPPKPKQPAATLTVSSSSFPAHRPSLSLDRQNLGNSGCLASNARAHPHSHTNNQRQAPIISDHYSRNTIPPTDSTTTERPSLLNHIKASKENRAGRNGCQAGQGQLTKSKNKDRPTGRGLSETAVASRMLRGSVPPSHSTQPSSTRLTTHQNHRTGAVPKHVTPVEVGGSGDGRRAGNSAAGRLPEGSRVRIPPGGTHTAVRYRPGVPKKRSNGLATTNGSSNGGPPTNPWNRQTTAGTSDGQSASNTQPLIVGSSYLSRPSATLFSTQNGTSRHQHKQHRQTPSTSTKPRCLPAARWV
ncbi:unnamed protein product [Vitrella brassicaformis CCMP3155]|uniref:Uncharacterized protein n=1 Tax=Vitrella brassicaformis (strain CCMP3155) TaxID=1169540 RepID=A0A0G4G2B8_VITBC|nr:unnamed protein product [Vitrella brassicaformis CCMP3155]|eukprot:CEM22130.1 unnamed protein product [Vitrella brassicaformis CCMP3155]